MPVSIKEVRCGELGLKYGPSSIAWVWLLLLVHWGVAGNTCATAAVTALLVVAIALVCGAATVVVADVAVAKLAVGLAWIAVLATVWVALEVAALVTVGAVLGALVGCKPDTAGLVACSPQAAKTSAGVTMAATRINFRRDIRTLFCFFTVYTP